MQNIIFAIPLSPSLTPLLSACQQFQVRQFLDLLFHFTRWIFPSRPEYITNLKCHVIIIFLLLFSIAEDIRYPD